MKLVLLVIGRTRSDYLQTGIDTYAGRISRYMPFEIKTLPDVKSTKALTEQQQKEKEGAMMTEAFQPGDRVILLDERGKEYTSREFAGFIDRSMSQSVK